MIAYTNISVVVSIPRRLLNLSALMRTTQLPFSLTVESYTVVPSTEQIELIGKGGSWIVCEIQKGMKSTPSLTIRAKVQIVRLWVTIVAEACRRSTTTTK
jgi:hypothetical protein